MTEPLLSYSEVREVAVLLWLGMLLLGGLAMDWGEPIKPKGRRKPVGVICPLHRVERDHCEDQHK